MKTVLRKIFSVLLALCLLTALMPFSVLEAEGDVCEIVDRTTYATLDDALEEVQDGDTIRLLENIDYDGGIMIEDKRVTFDLNRCTLDVVNTAEAGTAEDGSGLYVKGNAAVALTGEGEFNVTGTWYGVYAECEIGEVAEATVTNATGNIYAGVMSYRSKVTVKENVTSSGVGSYGVSASFENAEVTVEGDVIATDDMSVGVEANSLAIVTVNGNITVNGSDTLGIEAYDEGDVNVEGNVTVSGDDSVGIHAAGSYVTVAGNVTGDYGGVDASVSSSIEITGDVRSLDASGFGVQAIDNCFIDVGGNVESIGTGVLLTGTEEDSQSEITIDGVIKALVYVQIGDGILYFDDYVLDTYIIEGYRIYTTDSNLGAVFVADFAGGDGSETNPYLIETVDQLNDVRNYMGTEHADKHFKLMANLDLNVAPYNSGEGWEPIGSNSTDDAFTGTFDGAGHTISSFFINRSDADYVGLFGYTGEGSEIQDVVLLEADVTGKYYVGTLAGRNCGLVTNSYVTGGVTGKSDVGGLVGQNDDSIIDSYFIGTVTANYGSTGGLVGDNNGTITNCHTEATVTSVDDYIGGLAGENFGPITDSYAAGTVTGDDYVGGLVGWNFSGDGNNGEITASYSTCTVKGTWDVGGLVGDNSGLIDNSFATGIVTGEIDIGGLAGSNYSSITNSYATGDVEGDAAVGGLIGYNITSIINCYAIGAVEGGDDVGGLVGDNGSSDSGTATNSYWDTEASGLDTSAGGEGKATAEMKQQETYDDWDFEDEEIWGINNSDNDGYPFLRWQGYEHGQTNAPPVLSETGASFITATTVTLNFTSDKAGTYYYLVYAAAEAAPDAATIIAQGEAADKGTDTAAAAANAVEVTGLTASTAYKAYVIVEDTEENISNVAVISFTTITAEVPIGAAISPALCTFDLESPGNVSTTITWGSATTVTDVVYGTTPLATPADYNVSGNTLIITAGYLEGLNLSAGDTVGFEISFDVGDNATFTVEAVQNYTPDSDATLSDLLVCGSTVNGFTPSTYTYNIELPHGSLPGSATSTVGATPSDSKATINITQAASLPGSAIVEVTAEDTMTTQTYTVNFTLEAASNNPSNRKTGIPATTSVSVTVNTAYTLDLSTIFEDADSEPLTYTVSVDGANPVAAAANYVYTPTSAGDTILVFKANDGTADSTDTYTVTLTANAAPPQTYALTITAGKGGRITTGSSGNYAAGTVISIAATPSSRYSFNKWSSVGGGTFGSTTNASTTFTMPANAVTITVGFTYNGSGGGNGGGGGSNTPSTPSPPTYRADVKAGNGTETTLPVTVDKDAGTASIAVGSQSFAQGGTVITIPSIPDVDTYSVGIPVPDLSTTDVQGTLTLNTDAGSITVPSNMLTGVADTDGNKAQITIGQGDKSNLSEDVKDAIGDRPLVQLTLSIDGKQTNWNNQETLVTVSIPYTPTATELANPESIVIWYIDGSGNVVSVPNGRYDPETGTVTFITTHFSYYAVSYNQVSFKDVANDAWYAKVVSFIAAREITTGTGGGNFSPEAKLTRGEFLVMLMKAYGIAPNLNPKDNFTDAGNTYYTGYLATAKRLSISAGKGNNMFAPAKEVTRQEMFTLLYNALKAIGQLPQGDSGKMLSDFTDAGQIDAWAKDAMTLLVKIGTAGGINGKLTPLNTTTRAEMAQVLYNLLGK